jgi:hypothetical protein
MMPPVDSSERSVAIAKQECSCYGFVSRQHKMTHGKCASEIAVGKIPCAES